MTEKEAGSKRKIAVVFALAVILFAVGYIFNKPKDTTVTPDAYPIKTVVSGATVYSKIPVEQLALWDDLALYESTAPGTLACNLELSVLRPKPQARAYGVEVEEGDSGIFIDERKALIRGRDAGEILYNCHVVGCLLTNVSCPDDLDEIKRLMWFTEELNVVLDSNLSAQAMGAYAELMGPLGFYQIMKADVNKDGNLDETERLANRLFILPYFKVNGSCVLQPLKNLVQEMNRSLSVTRDCDMSPAIIIEESPVSEIRIDGGKIYLRGDSSALRGEAIIVGDIIAPDWIVSFRQAG